MKRKILLQLDSDRLPSVFDAVTACDAGADVLLARGGVKPEDVRDQIYGLLFTRGGEDLKSSAAFIGGSDVEAGEALFQAARDSFFGPFKVSLMLDSNGCNTTAAAAVAKIRGAMDLSGKKVVVLAGTGPVGQRAAGLLAGEGAEVVITSRRLDRVQAACLAVEKRFGKKTAPAEVSDEQSSRRVLAGANAVLCTGAAGVQLIPEAMWADNASLAVLADINAVPPVGVQGLEPQCDGQERHGKKLYGALGIGGLKMLVHRACVAQLFERDDLILDAEAVYAVAKEIATSWNSSWRA
jgi:hypothetical protein